MKKEIKPIDEMTPAEKIEYETAADFLKLYNKKYRASYEICSMAGSKPEIDVTCENKKGDVLCLEITLLENRTGDAKYHLGRGEKPEGDDCMPEHAVPMIIDRINDKMQRHFGKNTALILRQLNDNWEAKDWEVYKDKIREETTAKSENPYEKGIWVLCRKIRHKSRAGNDIEFDLFRIDEEI